MQVNHKRNEGMYIMHVFYLNRDSFICFSAGGSTGSGVNMGKCQEQGVQRPADQQPPDHRDHGWAWVIALGQSCLLINDGWRSPTLMETILHGAVIMLTGIDTVWFCSCDAVEFCADWNFQEHRSAAHWMVREVWRGPLQNYGGGQCLHGAAYLWLWVSVSRSSHG